jgi:hypothetical protein
VQLIDRNLLLRGDCDDLLSQNVERIPRDDRLLDLARTHLLDDHGRLEQVGAELGEDPALRDGAELVAGAPDPLEPARHGLRRLDLDDEVDGAHVDPQLERRRGDEAGNLAFLEQLLDLEPLLAGQRAVVRPGDLLLGELVQAQREALGESAVVDEDDRRAVLLDEPQDLRVDRRPDRRLRALRARAEDVGTVRPGAGFSHVFQGDDDLEVELLGATGVHELDRAAARDEAADLLERSLRRRQADALEGPTGQALETLHRERQVGPALGAGDRVHLVEDQRLDAPERVARLRRQQQEERFGGGDEDVGRVAEERLALLLRRVARANRHAQLALETGERAAKVALDVVVERLQRRDVEQAQAVAGLRRQPVDAIQERGQRLARTRRRLDERVLAARDRGPAELLGRRRRVEGPLEPRPRLGAEGRQRAHRPSVHAFATVPVSWFAP